MDNKTRNILIIIVVILFIAFIITAWRMGWLVRWGLLKSPSVDLENKRLDNEYCFGPSRMASGREEGDPCTDSPTIVKSFDGDTKAVIAQAVKNEIPLSGPSENYVKMCKNDQGKFVYAPMNVKYDSSFVLNYCDVVNTKMCKTACEVNKP